MTQVEIDDYGRPHPPANADEVETLLGFLDYQRATLARKCRGLDDADLSATVGVSTITLGGLLMHVAYVEDNWFSYWLRGEERQPPWTDETWSTDQDWALAVGKSGAELDAIWRVAVERSRAKLAAALAEGGMDSPAKRVKHGEQPSLRWIVVHMIEEYARHNGHADLIREAVDGQTGE